MYVVKIKITTADVDEILIADDHLTIPSTNVDAPFVVNTKIYSAISIYDRIH